MQYLSELVGSGAWRGFCHPGTNWLHTGVIAVQADIEPVLNPGAGTWPKAPVQCRGAVIPKPGHESRYRSTIVTDAGIRV
jgi:hypothetical protein